MVSEECKTLYNKLNTFVTKVINRDVQPQIDNKLEKGDWTTLSNTESYVTTKAGMITTDAWTDANEIATITQTTITVNNDGILNYSNHTNKKVNIELSITSGRVVINGNIFEDDTINFNVDANKDFDIQCYSGTFIDYTVGTQSNIISSIIDVAYPVGSIYISSNTNHPSIIFGGVWEHFAEDKFLLSAGSTYGYNTTGGSADAVVVKHNHTQNAHTHTGASGRAFVTDISGTSLNESRFTAVSSGSTYTVRFASGDNWWGVPDVGNTTATNKESGEDGTGKNMPPYLAVYMWERVG